MKIIPAVDIKGGKCVRLFQGIMSQETVYSDSPLDMAKKWVDGGAERLHIVDLDGAVCGSPQNLESIEEISSSLNIEIEVGGGIRDVKTIEKYFSIGVDKVVVGTSAALNTPFTEEICNKFPGKIIIGVDAKDGKVAIHGWTEIIDKSVEQLLGELKGLDISDIIYTDISRDGAMEGPNIEAINEVCSLTDIPIIASGGISNISDVKSICDLKDSGINGMIIGKALYNGAISLKEALDACKKNNPMS